MVTWLQLVRCASPVIASWQQLSGYDIGRMLVRSLKPYWLSGTHASLAQGKLPWFRQPIELTTVI